MLSNLFTVSLPYSNLAVRVVAVFFFVLILLRLSGKRQIGQMSATEFVAVILISNAVQNSMNGGDNSLSGGLFLAAILVFASWLISLLTFHSRLWRNIFEGTPTLVINKGKLLEKNLKKELVSHQELRMMCRKQGVHDFHEVYTGVLESDSSLSIVRYADLEHIQQNTK